MRSPDSERLILQELQREFLEIARLRKLKFSLANVQLFDSISKWGEYDHLTKTIYLSRNLVTNFSWDHVLGILKHEMAHQWVFENYPQTDLMAHGQEFHLACEKLKIPQVYRASKVELTEDNADFSFSDHEKNPLIEKVKKLMSLASSNNEHEASLAAQRVRELYLKYNIEQADLQRKNQFQHLIISTYKKRLSILEKKAISILVEFYFVQAIVIQQFDAKSCQHYQALEVLGRQENILMAEYVYHFLLRSCDEIAKAESRQLSRVELSSLKLGILDGFSSKLKAQPLPEIAHGRELLVIAHRELENYMHDYFPRLRSLRSSSRQISSGDYNRGVERGKNLNLNKPISEKSRPSGLRISFSV